MSGSGILGRLRGAFRSASLENTGTDGLDDFLVEWQWLAAHVPSRPGRALDLAGGNVSACLAALHHGYEVTTVESMSGSRHFRHPRHECVVGDLFFLDLAPASFDLVLCCSRLSSLAIRPADADGGGRTPAGSKLTARLSQLTKPGGTLLMTVRLDSAEAASPVQAATVHESLLFLLQPFRTEKSSYFGRETDGTWLPVADSRAVLAGCSTSDGDWLSLACFVMSNGNLEAD